MSATLAALPPPSTTLLLLEGRAMPEFGAFWLLRPWLSATPRGDGHPVLVLPGLLADDSSTRPLRSFLNSHGYRTHGWKQGRNLGLRGSLERDMVARIDELFERYDRRKISLGSPFAGSPKSTNAWRAYEKVSGSKVDDQELLDTLVEAPPVPTSSIFSRSDGICAWQTCLNQDGPASENIEVYGSHCGLGHHPAAVYAIADRLAQPEGNWQKFDRSGWRALAFPDWRRD